MVPEDIKKQIMTREELMSQAVKKLGLKEVSRVSSTNRVFSLEHVESHIRSDHTLIRDLIDVGINLLEPGVDKILRLGVLRPSVEFSLGDSSLGPNFLMQFVFPSAKRKSPPPSDCRRLIKALSELGRIPSVEHPLFARLFESNDGRLELSCDEVGLRGLLKTWNVVNDLSPSRDSLFNDFLLRVIEDIGKRKAFILPDTARELQLHLVEVLGEEFGSLKKRVYPLPS